MTASQEVTTGSPVRAAIPVPRSWWMAGGLMVLALLAAGCGSPGQRAPVLTVADSSDVVLLFGGDTYFGETYSLLDGPSDPEHADASTPAGLGYGRALNWLAPLAVDAHATILNLETPLSTLSSSPFPDKGYLHRGDPDRSLAALADLNLRAVSLANNHTLDDGVPGLLQTFRALDRADVAAFGAGTDSLRAARPLRVDAHLGADTVTVLVAAGFEYRGSYDETYEWYAGVDRPGANGWPGHVAVEQLQRLRHAHPNALLIAYPHWGSNYAWADSEQRELARRMIDAGADLVLGHGAHQVQELERYNGRWIVYSLGNFAFLSPGRYGKENALPFSLAARLHLSSKTAPGTAALHLYPIHTDNRANGYQPRIATGSEFQRVHGELLRRADPSDSLITTVRARKDGLGWHLVLDVTFGAD